MRPLVDAAPNLRFSTRFARPTGGAGNVEDESKYVKTPESYTGVENYGWSVEWKRRGRRGTEGGVGWGGGWWEVGGGVGVSLPLWPGGQSALSLSLFGVRSACRPLTFRCWLRSSYRGVWQAQNATVATWAWHTSVVNKGPAGWTDALTIVQTGRNH